MHKPFSKRQKQISLSSSKRLVHALTALCEKGPAPIYVVGGTVRDYLLGRKSIDLDLAVYGSALNCAKMFQDELKGGSVIDLSGPEDEAFRVVFSGEQIDFASFRQEAKTIEQDLVLRDFSINALAISLQEVLQGDDFTIFDPSGGEKDLLAGRVVHLPGAFEADPLRMVRAFRLSAVLNFTIDKTTLLEVEQLASLIQNVAVERIHFELGKIFESPNTSKILKEMDDTGILRFIIPELYQGKGVKQPDFHHLDVFEHCFGALEKMENLLQNPERYFSNHIQLVVDYIKRKSTRAILKYAALFHDLGKPQTRGYSSRDQKRVTFYGHDEVGKDLSKQIAHRLKWSNDETLRVSHLVAMHMHPFHLCNVLRDGDLSRRAVLKLCHRAGDELVGLFMLALADSFASEGKLKPQNMEAEILLLFDNVVKMYHKLIEPVIKGPRLLTGKDLINEFKLSPGPLFSEILGDLEIARVEGKVQDRQTALHWVAEYLGHRIPVSDH